MTFVRKNIVRRQTKQAKMTIDNFDRFSKDYFVVEAFGRLTGMYGKFNVGTVTTQEEYIGKKVRLIVEVVKDDDQNN